MKFKINKTKTLIMVECPPCKRTVRFDSRVGSRSYFIEIPKHVFIFPVKASKGVFYVSGSYPLQFLLEEDGEFYLPSISIGHTDNDGSVCISFDHITIRADVKEAIERAIEQLWASPYESGSQGPYLIPKNKGKKFKEYLCPKKVSSVFSEISIEDLRKIIKETDNLVKNE